MRCQLLLALATVTGLLLCGCQADIYLHYPRGSNNRLNEASANRANANRMFDSQNNNRGGYNVGVYGGGQYDEKYFYGSGFESRLNLEWTMQHGCRDGRQQCRVVVQAMCQPLAGNPDADVMRNGNSTDTQAFTAAGADETYAAFVARKAASVSTTRGLHEPFEWYDACNKRERNRGLFTADQTLQGSSAIYTRQNPGGTRRGYECPEERDYYPYWVPSPWLDVAVLTDNAAECPALVAAAAAPVPACVRTFAGETDKRVWAVPENNAFDCAKNGGTFTPFYPYLEVASDIATEAACASRGYRWAVPYRHSLTSLRPACLVPPPPLDCRLAPRTRDNHLGDKAGGGPANYSWVLPNFPSGASQRCVLRLRYNLTSADSMPLLKQNPLVPPGLQLAVNTNQVGRVFQDRSHVFQLIKAPDGIAGGTLHHVGVRGKRGNIVQVYPAVEYDFSPTRLKARTGDHVLIQWSGSDTHNNGAPAGDGQAGDDGTGTTGTDRNNLVEAADASQNFPLPWESSRFLGQGSRVVWAWHGAAAGLADKDFALTLASAGYYRCFAAAVCGSESEEAKAVLDSTLNSAPASFPGLIIRLEKAGQFRFLCTRNNNFSNRSQKWLLTVTA